MTGGFLYWWGQQLRDCLPGQSAAGTTPRDALIIEVAGSEATTISLTLRRRRDERALGCFAPDAAGLRQAVRAGGATPIVLRLPPGMLLERELWLPLAAEGEMTRALSYELDRVTPFRPAEVYWSGAIIRRDRRGGRLLVLLLLAPRALAAPLIAAATGAGAPPMLLEGQVTGGDWRSLALTTTAWPSWQRHCLQATGLACAALAIAVAVTPVIRQASRSAAIEARIAALQPQVREAEALQQRLALDTMSSDLLATSRVEFGTALAMLATVTAALPDDTFLTDLTMQRRQLALRGQSANAAGLIGALSADPAIRNPSFAAPVTRAAAGGLDLFAITAEAAPTMDRAR
jgi:general secretion pathway protein L